MSKIAILTDSSCDIPQEMAEKYGIDIMSFHILLDDVDYVERVDCTNTEFYDKMRAAKGVPSTAAITPIQFCEKYCQYVDEGYTDVIHVPINKSGSSTYNNALMHDRSVIASITDRNITSDLAIRTLRKALESQPTIKDGLILHSDRGSQYTSKAFTEFCESVNVTQSMSKAGYPYDNAPMERYFNTLKNECTNLYEFTTEETLYQKVEEFAYVDYNHVRPHSYNGYRTPYEARTAA